MLSFSTAPYIERVKHCHAMEVNETLLGSIICILINDCKSEYWIQSEYWIIYPAKLTGISLAAWLWSNAFLINATKPVCADSRQCMLTWEIYHQANSDQRQKPHDRQTKSLFVGQYFPWLYLWHWIRDYDITWTQSWRRRRCRWPWGWLVIVFIHQMCRGMWSS